MKFRRNAVRSTGEATRLLFFSGDVLRVAVEKMRNGVHTCVTKVVTYAHDVKNEMPVTGIIGLHKGRTDPYCRNVPLSLRGTTLEYHTAGGTMNEDTHRHAA